MKALACTLLFGAVPAAAKDWKNSSELSLVSANGNTRASSFSAKDSFAAKLSPRTTVELDISGLGARSDGRATAERYESSEKLIFKLDERNYLLQQYRWARDRFAGYSHRHIISLGAGRELLKTGANLWKAEGGPGYLNEERIEEKRRSFASLRLYSKYLRHIRAGSELSQDFEWIQSLADKRDNRIRTETALIAPLSASVSLKNSFQWRHDSRPPSGKIKDDTVLSLALLASF